jgi:uncharacterized membrane protein YcaP (DUF421 family)
VTFDVDWAAVLVPKVSLVEIVVRGTVMYLGLFAAMRLLRREAGALGLADVLVVVLIADAAQNAMSADYRSLTEGFVLVGTIIFWNFLLDWLAYRFPSVRPLIYAPPLPLVENGRCLPRNMRREMISADELEGLLREHGVERVEDVKRAWLEGDGHLSVIKKDG